MACLDFPISEFENPEFWLKKYNQFLALSGDAHQRMSMLGFIPKENIGNASINSVEEFKNCAKNSDFLTGEMLKKAFGNYIEHSELEHLLKTGPGALKGINLEEAMFLFPGDEKGGVDYRELIKYLYN